MLTASDRAPDAIRGAIMVKGPNPALGIGRALRFAYTGVEAALPSDMQALLERLQ